ncbi:hypothetical protein PsAD2_03463 [Pseudovibrio axinellae]|uniref:Uncharacterized protein n=1 Tax=Pseudovibrio axinellae TaxID=989403 RepID=A0A165WAB3_9HYPH|nr:hypothetical protein PsAD2_03463 [Pseudovibrio axinellae]SER78830.1 hypothetical protein SAMN05421798_12319 [Pseudovibrio axinellae]
MTREWARVAPNTLMSAKRQLENGLMTEAHLGEGDVTQTFEPDCSGRSGGCLHP